MLLLPPVLVAMHIHLCCSLNGARPGRFVGCFADESESGSDEDGGGAGEAGGAGGAGAVAEEERLPEDEQKVFEIIEPLEGGAGRVVEHRSQKAFEAVDAVRP